MGFFNNFPYTNFHELNLDWLLNQMKELGQAFEDFAASNHLVYSDPIAWDITKNYNPNTLVVHDDVAYVSKQRVPAGIDITNRDYWIAAFDASGYNILQDQIYSLGITIGNQADMIDDLEAGTTLPDYVNFPAQRFTNTYALCFGDSNTLENEPAGYGNWFRVFCQWVEVKGYKSYGVSDACIQNDIAGKPTISSQIAGANDFPADQVGLVFLMGGINDFHYGTYDSNAFGAAVKSTVQQIHAKFPKALIVSLMDCGHQLPNGRMLYYNEAMQRNTTVIASGYKAIFVSLADLSLQDNLWANQNHYSGRGAYAIAARLMNAMFGEGPGYTPAPRRTDTEYDSGNTSGYGAYNFRVNTLTTIDPDTLIRRDHSVITTYLDFNAGSNPGSGICEVPGMFDPVRHVNAAGYVPAFMLRNGNRCKVNAVKLYNLTPNNAGDGGHAEPRIRVELPYYADETWANWYGNIEIDTEITISDT